MDDACMDGTRPERIAPLEPREDACPHVHATATSRSAPVVALERPCKQETVSAVRVPCELGGVQHVDARGPSLVNILPRGGSLLHPVRFPSASLPHATWFIPKSK